MMLRLPIIILCAVFTLVNLAGCSRQQIYDTAIGFERNSADLEPRTVQVDHLTIAYLTNPPIRNAPTLVMLHGFGANKDNWVRMAAPLTERYNVLAIDLPGHGESSKPLDIGYTIADQVGYVHDILTAIKPAAPVSLIGNSMGGAITALYAATYPDQVKAAVLIDPAGIFEYDSELVDRVKHGENPLIVSKPGDFAKLVDFALEKKPFVPWPIYSVMEDKALANEAVNRVIFAAIRDSGYQPAFRNALKQITAPVLVLWGREDRVINVRNADLFVDLIPDARKIVLDGLGHAPMVEDPDLTAALVDDFMTDAYHRDSE